jgi:hypothetical protein
VNHLAGDPDRLKGLVNGVKGKLFELDYAEWLNHGHLPDGLSAELAHHANNPGWDIAIHDAHGHIDSLLQLKATESLGYVREALATHANIDVVVPHELYEKLIDHPDMVHHVLDGHESIGHINGHVADAVGHAEVAGATAHFPFLGPVFVIAIAAFLNYKRYRQGQMTPAEALRNIGERGGLATLASAATWLTFLATHEPIIGLPTSLAVRLVGGQVLHNWRRRKLLDGLIIRIAESRGELEIQVRRPLLEAETPVVWYGQEI